MYAANLFSVQQFRVRVLRYVSQRVRRVGVPCSLVVAFFTRLLQWQLNGSKAVQYLTWTTEADHQLEHENIYLKKPVGMNITYHPSTPQGQNQPLAAHALLDAAETIARLMRASTRAAMPSTSETSRSSTAPPLTMASTSRSSSWLPRMSTWSAEGNGRARRVECGAAPARLAHVTEREDGGRPVAVGQQHAIAHRHAVGAKPVDGAVDGEGGRLCRVGAHVAHRVATLSRQPHPVKAVDLEAWRVGQRRE
eukprot:scaffold14457_cov48-Phaeocystis_antarctica.AAC.2